MSGFSDAVNRLQGGWDNAMDSLFGLPVRSVDPMDKSYPTTMEVGMSGVGVPAFDDRMDTLNLRIPRQFLTLKQIDSIFSASDIGQTILRTLEDEIFRNGFDIDELFSYKCSKCGKKFDDDKITCDECGGLIDTPNWKERKKLSRWLPKADVHSSVNRFNQNLKQVCKQAERDLNKYDNGYIFLQKGYVFNTYGVLISNPVKEIYRASPYWMRKVFSSHGLSRNGKGEWGYACVNHRMNLEWKRLEGHYRCKECNREMFKVEFAAKQHQGEEREMYYVRGEIYHLIKYEPNPGYGVSRMFVIWIKLLTLYQMDKYIWKMFSLQRSPRGLLFLRGKLEHVEKSWLWMRNMSRQNPNMVYPIAVDPVIGGSDKTGNLAQYVDLAIDLSLMQFIEMRQEFRTAIGMVFGVEPIFQGDLSTGGGLNNEGLQVTVTNRAMSEGQNVWNEFFIWFSYQLGIHDLVIALNPSEEKDEKAQEERVGYRLKNAREAQGLGYDIELYESDDGLDFHLGEKDPSLRQGMGMNGFGGGGGGGMSESAGFTGAPNDGQQTQAYNQGYSGMPDIQTQTKELKKELDTAPPHSNVAGQEYDGDPSESQKKTGHYKKPHLKYNNDSIVIENPVGSVRSGTSPGGNHWETRMAADYGYILGTIGADKDHLDVFIKPGTDGSKGNVYVIDQVNGDGKFDEHKIMFGYSSIDDATIGYQANYEWDWGGLGQITELNPEEWIKWKSKRSNLKKPIGLMELKKARIYIKDPGAAPVGANVQEGKRGGHYYETGMRGKELEEITERESIPKKLLSQREHIGKPKFNYQIGKIGERLMYDVMSNYGTDQYELHEITDWSSAFDMFNPDELVEIKTTAHGKTQIWPNQKQKKIQLAEDQGKTINIFFLWVKEDGIEVYQHTPDESFYGSPDEMYMVTAEKSQLIGKFDSEGNWGQES